MSGEPFQQRSDHLWFVCGLKALKPQSVKHGSIVKSLLLFVFLKNITTFQLFSVSLIGLPPLLGMLLAGIGISNVNHALEISEDIDAYWKEVLRDIAFITILVRAGLSLNPKGYITKTKRANVIESYHYFSRRFFKKRVDYSQFFSSVFFFDTPELTKIVLPKVLQNFKAPNCTFSPSELDDESCSFFFSIAVSLSIFFGIVRFFQIFFHQRVPLQNFRGFREEENTLTN